MLNNLPDKVKVVEVSPRDGLQNEPTPIPAAVKIEFINLLSQSGLQSIEATSFVSPKWIPQLADAAEVYGSIERKPGLSYPVLVPNLTGLRRAIKAGAHEVAIFTAASDTFNRKNTNVSIDESLERFEKVMLLAKQKGLLVRGYISCVLGCPYEGDISPAKVARVARALRDMGCYEISLGDTIGIGTPLQAQHMVGAVIEETGADCLALHFHDTRGQALANVMACLALGVSVVDSSVAALGGCPYANGARGNVASEDLLYMLNGLGISTGVDINRLVDASLFISDALGRAPSSRLGQLALERKARAAPTRHAPAGLT